MINQYVPAMDQLNEAGALAPFTITDRRGRHAFTFTTSKPPAVYAGRVIPASERNAPDPASYMIFNDENGDERGGLVASSSRTFLTLDYPNADAVELYAETEDECPGAGLTIRTMPDAALPPDQAWPGSAPAAQIGWRQGLGSMLMLHDSHGKPRIVLSVGPDDVPRIQVLDPEGNLVRDLAE